MDRAEGCFATGLGAPKAVLPNWEKGASCDGSEDCPAREPLEFADAPKRDAPVFAEPKEKEDAPPELGCSKRPVPPVFDEVSMKKEASFGSDWPKMPGWVPKLETELSQKRKEGWLRFEFFASAEPVPNVKLGKASGVAALADELKLNTKPLLGVSEAGCASFRESCEMSGTLSPTFFDGFSGVFWAEFCAEALVFDRVCMDHFKQFGEENSQLCARAISEVIL